MKCAPNKPTQRKFLAKQVRLIRYPLEKLLQRYVQLELSVSCHFTDKGVQWKGLKFLRSSHWTLVDGGWAEIISFTDTDVQRL